MKSYREKIILALCVLLFASALMAEDVFVRQKSRAVFCDVGQGDGIFINLESGEPFFAKATNGTQIVIDGGPDNKMIGCVGKHMPYFDRTIEYLIISHPDKDHFVGAVEILRRYTVEKVFINGDESNIPEYKEFLKEAEGKIIVADKNNDIDFKNGKIYFLQSRKYKDSNDGSLVFKFLYGKKSILFTGDISENVEGDLLADSSIRLQSDIIKISHHGSKTSSGDYFLEVINPELAIISVGADNNFGHPSYRVLKRLERLGINYKRTDEIGNIVIALSD